MIFTIRRPVLKPPKGKLYPKNPGMSKSKGIIPIHSKLDGIGTRKIRNSIGRGLDFIRDMYQESIWSLIQSRIGSFT